MHSLKNDGISISSRQIDTIARITLTLILILSAGAAVLLLTSEGRISRSPTAPTSLLGLGALALGGLALPLLRIVTPTRKWRFWSAGIFAIASLCHATILGPPLAVPFQNVISVVVCIVAAGGTVSLIIFSPSDSEPPSRSLM